MLISIINGPNINLLGKREATHYGSFTLSDLENELNIFCKSNANAIKKKITLDFFQSNHEGNIIDYIHLLSEKKVNAIIINAAAFTHTSIAIRDALLGVNIPFIEVHISNIYKRENFRHTSYLSDIAKGCIIGLGKEGYLLALDYFIKDL